MSSVRFREQYATSIGETLIAIRLAEAKRLLHIFRLQTAVSNRDIARKKPTPQPEVAAQRRLAVNWLQLAAILPPFV